MDATRETKEVKIGEHVAVIKTYLTGREANEARAFLLTGMEVESGSTERPKIPLSTLIPHERKVLEMLLVSFDASTEAPIEKLEDLPSSEYDLFVAEIKKESKAFLGQTK